MSRRRGQVSIHIPKGSMHVLYSYMEPIGIPIYLELSRLIKSTGGARFPTGAVVLLVVKHTTYDCTLWEVTDWRPPVVRAGLPRVRLLFFAVLRKFLLALCCVSGPGSYFN